MKVAVSYISSNYSLDETIKKIVSSKADYIHYDIMDGMYVPNNNFYKKELMNIQDLAFKRSDVHLMVNNPIKYIKYFKNNKYVDIIYAHPKTIIDINKYIKKLKSYNIKFGIVVNPDESIEDFYDILSYVDGILIMTVMPGAGGQDFMSSLIPKIKNIVALKEEYSLTVALDGGINENTIKLVKDIDLDYVVSGSFICKSEDFDESIKLLK